MYVCVRNMCVNEHKYVQVYGYVCKCVYVSVYLRGYECQCMCVHVCAHVGCAYGRVCMFAWVDRCTRVDM